MSDLAGRKVFKVFNQEFVVDERYNVTKELGQGAYGIVWYAQVPRFRCIRRMLAHTHTARPPTTRPAKASRSRKSPMFSARKS